MRLAHWFFTVMTIIFIVAADRGLLASWPSIAFSGIFALLAIAWKPEAKS